MHKKERKNRLDACAPKCLWRDKCTIRSACSQAACTSCLIPGSDTLPPCPPPLFSFALCCLIWALLLNEELHTATSKTGSFTIWLSGDSSTPHFFVQCRQTCATLMHLSVAYFSLPRSVLRKGENQKTSNMKTGEELCKR